MAGEYIFTIEDLSKSFGPKVLFKDIHLSFYHKAKIGIVGENGTGKSTLIRIMAGEEKDYHGTAKPMKGIRIGYLPQEPRLDPAKTVRQEVETAFSHITDMVAEYEKISESMSKPMSEADMEKALEKMSRLQETIEAADGWELKRHVDVAMDALVLPPDDLLVEKISGGEARRVALCKLLLQKPDILLLDEPTNHLDAETVAWLETTLQEYPGNVIVVTHDRYFLDTITKWILELDRGQGIPFEGNYSSWLEQKAARLKLEEKKASSLRKRLDQELDWMRMTPSGRSVKNKARVREYETLSSQQKSVDENSLDIEVVPGPPLGAKVIEAKDMGKAFGDNVLMKDVNFDIPRGAVIGLVGPNGVGKTTLFRMIVGEEKPDSGQLVVGPSVVISYVDQKRETLDPNKTVFEEIGGGSDYLDIGGKPVHTRLYLGRFNFKGTDQQKRVGSLSGGERNRLHLAKQMLTGGNVLLLDEPTNDLDVDTIRALENAILNYSGCVLVISHDRFFLDRICTHLIVFEGTGRLRWFEGNFQDYREFHQKELGGREENRRSKYKKLTIR
ncbi:MAG TPA: energy-dependent translational throttle protein EttA [Elusimicrobiota bacterium]|nr:energy-dependent translational throttle protein EttA [Elusimicrobiota bacterium]